MAGLVAYHEPDARHPKEKIGDIAQFPGEERDRFEQNCNGRDKDDRRRREEEILFEKDERLDRRLAAHD